MEQPTAEDREQILTLCSMASLPYDDFVWGSPSRARTVAEVLWDQNVGEVSPAYCTVWRDAFEIRGVLVVLNGKQLRRERLRAAIALSRTANVEITAGERQRAQLAAGSLAVVGDDALYLARIAVVSHARGTGLARRMVDQLLITGRSHHAREIVLEVMESNHAAVQLYLSVGFKITNKTEAIADRRTLNFFEMRLPLT